MKLGILGGGQLAQMLTLATYPLGIRTHCLDPNPQACANDLTTVVTAGFDDESALDAFLAEIDCVTIETENIPLACADYVLARKPLMPARKALETTQDRLNEKNFFQTLDIPTAPYFDIKSEQDLKDALQKTGFPAILKTRRFGYDGKGQFFIKDESDIAKAWEGHQSSALILEGFVNFDYEVSLIAVRSQSGEMAFYPLVQNEHKDGILRYSTAPFCNTELQQLAESHAKKMLNELDYVGVLTTEFFFDGQQLVANEMAPRVHNSGHWTIEGTQCSQFENHVRAVCGLPLGSTATVGQSFMVNMIGQPLDREQCLQIPGVHYHSYGKEPRPNRKIGHVTLVDTDERRFEESKNKLKALN